jgi:hypothetical protein
MFLAILCCGTAMAADKPLDVRDLMTANQFHVTGLDKLAPEQLTAFDAWLAGYTRAAAAGKAPDVRDLVSANQFHATGLDQLSPQELSAFNGWLANYRSPAAPAPAAPAAVPAPAAASTGKFGQEMLAPDTHGAPNRIESRILGTFKGWNGRTTFKLENGQVWQQADSSTFDTTLQDPQVVIKSLGIGYLLTLPGHSATVFVRRVH